MPGIGAQSNPLFIGNPDIPGSASFQASRFSTIMFDFSRFKPGGNVPLQETLFNIFDIAGAGMNSVRGALIDNSLNPYGCSLVIADTGQIIRCPAFCQRRAPIYTGTALISFRMTTLCASVGAPISVSLFNKPLEDFCEYVQNPQLTPTSGLSSSVSPVGSHVGGATFSAKLINVFTVFAVVLPPNPFRTGIAAFNNGATASAVIYLGWSQFTNTSGIINEAQPTTAFAALSVGQTYERYQSHPEYPLPQCQLWASTSVSQAAISLNIAEFSQ